MADDTYTKPLPSNFSVEVTMELGDLELDQLWPDEDGPRPVTMGHIIALLSEHETTISTGGWGKLELCVNGYPVSFHKRKMEETME